MNRNRENTVIHFMDRAFHQSCTDAPPEGDNWTMFEEQAVTCEGCRFILGLEGTKEGKTDDGYTRGGKDDR